MTNSPFDVVIVLPGHKDVPDDCEAEEDGIDEELVEGQDVSVSGPKGPLLKITCSVQPNGRGKLDVDEVEEGQIVCITGGESETTVITVVEHPDGSVEVGVPVTQILPSSLSPLARVTSDVV